MQNLKWVLPIIMLLSACGGSGDQSGGADSTNERTEIRLKQYMVQGKGLYQIHCSNCHQEDGRGFAKLYPPLSGSDFLLADLRRAACIIRNGLQGEMTVNNTVYNLPMPANEQLTPIEIAEILTYVGNSWENEAGLTSTRDVTQWLQLCETKKP